GGLPGRGHVPVFRRHRHHRLYGELHPRGAGLRIWRAASGRKEGAGMARGPGLSVAIAEKTFPSGSVPLFSGLRPDVAPGSTEAVLGPSDVGKSTLVRLVAGIDTDLSGRIVVDGRDAALAPAPGFVFQDPRLLPWLTVGGNLRLADPALGAEAVNRLLASVGLAGRQDDFPHRLSG